MRSTKRATSAPALDFTYFLNLAGEHAWKAGVAFTRATVNKNTMWNAP